MSPRPTPPAPDDALLGRLVDDLLGETIAEEARGLAARLATEPDAAALHAGLARLLAAEQARLAPELEQARRDALVMARTVRETARSLERREPVDGRRMGRPRFSLPRVLALSVALNAAALVLLAVLLGESGPSRTPRDGGLIAARVEPADPGAAEVGEDGPALLEVADWLAEAASTPEGLARVPEAVLGGGLGVARRDEALGDELDALADVLGGSLGPRDRLPLAEHPPAVAIPMLVRRMDGLRRERLTRLGWDPAVTTRHVQRTLTWLRLNQLEDGGLLADGGTTREAVTALGMLPFLGEGRSSRSDGAGAADGAWLARASVWLRERLLERTPAGLVVRHGAPADALAPAALALAEDYMLAYGHLGVREVAARTEEIRTLLTAAAEGSPSAGSDQAAGPWRVWAVDAAARAGVRPLGADDPGFARWAASAAEGPAGLPAASVGLAALEGVTARVYRQLAGKTVERALPPPSVAPPEHAVGRILDALAWQAAYRTY